MSSNDKGKGPSGPVLTIYDTCAQDLLRTLSDPDFCQDLDELAQVLSRNRQRLIDGLSTFEAPQTGAASGATQGEGTKAFVAKIARYLHLSTAFAQRLLRMYLTKTSRERAFTFVSTANATATATATASSESSKASSSSSTTNVSFKFDAATLDDIMLFYCAERRAILQCISVLIRSVDENQPSARQRVLHTALDSLIKDGALRTSLVSQFGARLKWSPPESSNAQLLARSSLVEVEELLECLVALYYQQSVCTAEQLLEMATLVCKDAKWGYAMPDSVLECMSPNESRPRILRFGVLSTVLLIECLNLERLAPEIDSSLQPSEFSPQHLHSIVDDHPVVGNTLVRTKLDELFRSLARPLAPHQQRVPANTIVSSSSLAAPPPFWPVLLAWACAMVRVHTIKSAAQDADPNSVTAHDTTVAQHRRLCELSVHQGGLEYMQQALAGAIDPFTRHAPSLMSSRSVYKGLFSTLLCSFHAQALGVPRCIALAGEIFRDEPSLCKQFWLNDYLTDAGRALLVEAAARFPYEYAPLLRLLTDLCGRDAECADAIFTYFAALPSFAAPLASLRLEGCVCPLHTDDDDNDDGDGHHRHGRLPRGADSTQHWQLVRPWTAFPAPGTTNTQTCFPHLRLLPGITGMSLPSSSLQLQSHSMSSMSTSVAPSPTVSWLAGVSGWHICVLFLDQYLHATTNGTSGDDTYVNSSDNNNNHNNNNNSSIDASFHSATASAAPGGGALSVEAPVHKAIAVLELVVALFHAKPSLVEECEAHLMSIAEMHVGADEPPLRSRLLAILKHCEMLPRPPPRLLTACLHCVDAMTRVDAAGIAAGLLQSGVIPGQGHAHVLSDGGCVPRILRTWERVCGVYDTTIAFVQLTNTLVRHALKATMRPLSASSAHHARAIVTANEESLLTAASLSLAYVRDEVFAWHGQWRYRRRVQRHEIACGSLDLFNRVLWLGPRSSPQSMHAELTRRFLHDATIFNSLLATVVGSVAANSSRSGGGSARSRATDGAQAHSSDESTMVTSEFVDTDRSEVTSESLLRRLSTRAFTILDRLLAHATPLGGSELSPSSATFERTERSEPVTPLERALFSRTGQEDGSPHLIAVLSSYVQHSYTPAVIAATNVLTRLCHVAARWRPRPPSMVGYLGNAADAYRSQYIARLRDEHEHDNLRAAILDFLTAAVQTQPALAALFLGVDPTSLATTTDVALEADDSNKTATTKESTAPATAKESAAKEAAAKKESAAHATTTAVPRRPDCLELVLALVRRSNAGVFSAPVLQSSAAGLLRALWSRASDYHAVLETLRTDSVWRDLQAAFLACDDDDDAPSNVPVAMHNGSVCVDMCHRQLTRGHLLHVFALELFREQSAVNPALSSAIETCALHTAIIELAPRERVGAGVVKLLEEAAQSLGIQLNDFRTPPADRVHGDRYVYDAGALEQLLLRAATATTLSAQQDATAAVEQSGMDVDERDDECEQWRTFGRRFLTNVIESNRGWALTHARLHALRAWRWLLDVISSCHPSILLRHNKTTTTTTTTTSAAAAASAASSGDNQYYAVVRGVAGALEEPQSIDLRCYIELSSVMLTLLRRPMLLTVPQCLAVLHSLTVGLENATSGEQWEIASVRVPLYTCAMLLLQHIRHCRSDEMRATATTIYDDAKKYINAGERAALALLPFACTSLKVHLEHDIHGDLRHDQSQQQHQRQQQQHHHHHQAAVASNWGVSASSQSASLSADERAADEAARDGACVTVSLLSELVHHIKAPSAWLPALSRDGTLMTLLYSACEALSGRVHLKFTEMCLQLFLGAAGHASVAAELAQLGLVSRLCNALRRLSETRVVPERDLTLDPTNKTAVTATKFSQRQEMKQQQQQQAEMAQSSSATVSGIQAYIGGKRNGWHLVWCLSLGVLRTALSTLGVVNSFADDCVSFVGVHGEQFERALYAPCTTDGPNRLTLGALEEAVSVLGFLIALSRHRRIWQQQLPAALLTLVRACAVGTSSATRLLERRVTTAGLNPMITGGLVLPTTSSGTGSSTCSVIRLVVRPVSEEENTLDKTLVRELVTDSNKNANTTSATGASGALTSTPLKSTPAATGSTTSSSSAALRRSSRSPSPGSAHASSVDQVDTSSLTCFARDVEVLIFEYVRHGLALQCKLTPNNLVTDQHQAPVYEMDMSETGSGVASLGKLIALQKLCEERLRRPSPSTQCLTFILEHALSLAVSQTILHINECIMTHHPQQHQHNIQQVRSDMGREMRSILEQLHRHSTSTSSASATPSPSKDTPSTSSSRRRSALSSAKLDSSASLLFSAPDHLFFKYIYNLVRDW